MKDILQIRSIHDSFSIDLIKLDEILRHWTTSFILMFISSQHLMYSQMHIPWQETWQ